MATLHTKLANISTSTQKRMSRRRRKVATSQFGNAKTMAHGNYPWTWQSQRSDPFEATSVCSIKLNPEFDPAIFGTVYWNLAHPINHTLSGARDRLVPFLQKFGENRKVLYWVLRRLRVGLNIDNVGGGMPGKILFKGGPGTRQNPAASIEIGDRSAEHITRERKRCDVTRARTSVSV